MPIINCEIKLVLTWSVRIMLYLMLLQIKQQHDNSSCNSWFKTLCSRCNFINYCNNENQDSDAQLTETNINQKGQHKICFKPIFRLFNWPNLSGSKQTFCFSI